MAVSLVTVGVSGLVVTSGAGPLALRSEIAGACSVSFCWLRLSVADRDLVFQDFTLVVLPGMRLGLLGARWGVACGAPRAPDPNPNSGCELM